MKEKERDILAERHELKNMPYSIPEGYFEGFKMNMKPYGCVRTRRKAVMYASAAASAAILLTAGILLSQRTSSADEFTHEDYLVFSDSMINSLNSEYYGYTNEQYAEAEMANDDIIDYLIYSGITAEEIEHYK